MGTATSKSGETTKENDVDEFLALTNLKISLGHIFLPFRPAIVFRNILNSLENFDEIALK